jgi:GTP-binding protein HflX
VDVGQRPVFSEDHFEEFVELARSSGYTPKGYVLGRRREATPSHFLGSGKVIELAQCVRDQCCGQVIVNHALTSVQARNLNLATGAEILDRTGLILEIFSERARSYEGKLQVELARLRYAASRLVRGWSHLERQKGGIGLRGPGETQLESDRRLIAKRVSVLEHRLQNFEKHRAVERRARLNVPVVALVGYTNVGKSTLFREWTGAQATVADRLFATLDPTWRQVRLPFGATAVLVDTVGFIRDLPHELIAAFQTTLAETRTADLVLHVIDAGSGNRGRQIEVVEEVLSVIGAQSVPRIEVMNKTDRVGGRVGIERNIEGRPSRVWISARERRGLDLLAEAVLSFLEIPARWGYLELEMKEGGLRSALYRLGAVRSERQNRSGTLEMLLCMTGVRWKRIAHHFHVSCDRFVEIQEPDRETLGKTAVEF